MATKTTIKPKDLKKSAAAKKAAETKRQRPSFGSHDPWDILKQLEDDKQPWILMRYPYSLRLAPDYQGVCYEIVIWQTCEGDYGYANFEVTGELAWKIITYYGLTERKTYKKEGCTIWAKNDRLQVLHKKYVKEVERRKDRAHRAHELFLLLRDCEFLFPDDGELAELRDRTARAEREILDGIPKYTEDYLERNHIVIYNL